MGRMCVCVCVRAKICDVNYLIGVRRINQVPEDHLYNFPVFHCFFHITGTVSRPRQHWMHSISRCHTPSAPASSMLHSGEELYQKTRFTCVLIYSDHQYIKGRVKDHGMTMCVCVFVCVWCNHVCSPNLVAVPSSSLSSLCYPVCVVSLSCDLQPLTFTVPNIFDLVWPYSLTFNPWSKRASLASSASWSTVV